MERLRTFSSTLLCVVLAVASVHAWGENASEDDPSETLVRRSPALLERDSINQAHAPDLREIQFDEANVGALSSDRQAFDGVFAPHSSIAELHQFVSLKSAQPGARISHTRNPNGRFSLLRSTSETAASLFVSIGDGEAETLAARKTLRLDCDAFAEGSEFAIKNGDGKVIYADTIRCGDAISVHSEVAQ